MKNVSLRPLMGLEDVRYELNALRSASCDFGGRKEVFDAYERLFRDADGFNGALKILMSEWERAMFDDSEIGKDNQDMPLTDERARRLIETRKGLSRKEAEIFPRFSREFGAYINFSDVSGNTSTRIQRQYAQVSERLFHFGRYLAQESGVEGFNAPRGIWKNVRGKRKNN